MIVPVTLAGYTGRWRFRDAHLFSAWMASRPWDEGGTRVALVHLPTRRCEQVIIDGVMQEARAYEPDPARLRAEVLEVGASFEEALLLALEAPRARTQAEQLRIVGRILGTAYWVITVRAGDDALAVRDEAQGFLENCSKVGEHPTACVVVLHDGALVPDARDFSVGSLADGVLQEAERGADRLWRAFVASRMAWEAAGDLGVAQEFDHLLGGVALGAEALLEQALNRWAASRVAALSPELVRTTVSFLLKTAAASRGGLARLDADLRGEGVLWRPVGEQRSRPAPWLARGLLHSIPTHEARHVLRAAMVNGPLANEILRRCFDLESALVASLWAEHRGLEDKLADAQELLRRFNEGRLQECRLYPTECPAIPRDAWSFASLGEVLKVAPGLAGRGSPAERLQRLRNAMAHGHYVSWRAVKDVLDIEEELAEA